MTVVTGVTAGVTVMGLAEFKVGIPANVFVEVHKYVAVAPPVTAAVRVAEDPLQTVVVVGVTVTVGLVSTGIVTEILAVQPFASVPVTA